MGSFRIVTGSGYGRHEITDARELRREFDKLQRLARETTVSAPRVRVRKTSTAGRGADITKLYDDLWNELTRKANKWARETAAEMRASVPVDTGNLREAIHVLKDECIFDKSRGEIMMVVGADLDRAGGQGKLFAPPYRKFSPGYGRKTPPWQGYRVMPKYPNDYSYKYIGDGSGQIVEIFEDIALKNAKKIMGK